LSEKNTAGRITKNKNKTISLETKLDILRRFNKGERAVEIAKAVGLAPATVRTIRGRDGDKIEEAAKSATLLDAKTMICTRSALMIKMESLLSIWIENQVAQRIPLSKSIIDLASLVTGCVYLVLCDFCQFFINNCVTCALLCDLVQHNQRCLCFKSSVYV